MSENTSEHWKSPWSVVQFGWGAADTHKLTDIVTIDPETGSRWTVARVGFPDDPEAREIAHLMASAPHLRNALRGLMNYVLDIVPEEVYDEDERLQQMMAMANTVLAEAGTAGQERIPSNWRPLPTAAVGATS